MNKRNPLMFFWTGHFMYIGNSVDTTIHDHHAIQLAISFDDAIEIILPGSTTKLKGVIIDSDQQHECRTYNNMFLLLNIDPESKIGIGLKQTYLNGQKVAALPQTIVEDFLKHIKPLLLNHNNADSIYLTTVRFLHELSHTLETGLYDDRIIKVLNILRQVDARPIKIKALADEIYLSPSRLMHLFTEQVGIPIRKYILWIRLLTSLQKIIETKNITIAALEGGFSDAPHFNRTFKKMFGLNPSLLLKNSQIIQAYAN